MIDHSVFSVFPHRVKMLRYDPPSLVRAESIKLAMQWCSENIPHKNYGAAWSGYGVNDFLIFYFRNAEDATMFRMIYGL